MTTHWLIRLRALALVLTVSGSSFSLVDAAELRLRKGLVEQRADRALITVAARFDHVKSTVNTLDKDCDLHAPIRTEEIRVAVVGEFMNACSTGLDPAEVRRWTASGEEKIEGVLRIWFEHPGDKNEVLTEEKPLAAYSSSNPPHAVEVHPITRVGDRSFLSAIGPVQKDGQVFKAKGPQQLTSLLRRKITVQEYDGQDGEEYLSIESGCCLPNYFRLSAVFRSAPKATQDGRSAVVDLVSGQKVLAARIRMFSIDGTTANEAFGKLKTGTRFIFWGITRLDAAKLLKAAEDGTGESMPIPVEFVLLAIE